MSDGNESVPISFTITVHVGVTNTAPTFTSDATTAEVTTAGEDGEYSYTVVASNGDDALFGDVINFVATTLPDWLTFDTDTGVLSGTPTNDEVGDHLVVLTVIDAFGEPIPRLYAVGELGSFWSNLYLLDGNLGECFFSGRIAGRNAALERVRGKENDKGN